MRFNNQKNQKYIRVRRIGFLCAKTASLATLLSLSIGDSFFFFPDHSSALGLEPILLMAAEAPESPTTLTVENKTDIETFLKQSDTVHDIVQTEVADSLNRFVALLGLLGALTVIAGTYWARKTMKDQLQSVKQEMESEFQLEFHNNSLKLTEATSGLLGLVVSMENIRFLSDLSFNPISSESRQAIEHYPDVLKKFKESFKLQTLPMGFHVKLGDVLSLLGRHQLMEADSNHDEKAREDALQRFNDAITAYNEVLEPKPREEITADRRLWSEVLCKRGNSFAGLGNYNRAIADYKDALKINKDCYWAIHSQGDAYSALGEYKEAMRQYDEALQVLKIPENWHAETLYKKGVSFARQNKHEDARICYEKSLARSPNNSWVLHGLGDSLTSLKKYEEATQKYQEALVVNPRQYQTWRAWGDALYSINKHDRYEEAIDKYERALEISSEDGVADYEIHRRLGNTYLQLEEYFDAIRHYDEAIHLGDESFRLWACRAYAKERILKLDVLSDQEKKEYQQSIITDRNKALSKVNDAHHKSLRNHKNPSTEKSDFWYERAVCYALSNEKSIAIRDLAHAISQDEKYIEWAEKEIGFLSFQSEPDFRKLVENDRQLTPIDEPELSSPASK